MSQATQPPPPVGAKGERDKYQSPPPVPPAMTPPPSTSQELSYQQHPRTPTPTHSHLSSPPPTVKRRVDGRKRSVLDTDSVSQSSDQENDSTTIAELRTMLETAQQDVRSARTSAAHYRLQYELLSIESSEEIKRMGVELEMVRREVDVLQSARHNQPASVNHVPVQAALEWQNRCHELEAENRALLYRLADAKAALLEREDRNLEQIEQLRERIRENRKHANQLKKSVAPFGENLSRQPQHEAYSPPRNDNLAQLLLADQLLSREAASSPSTPVPARSQHHTRNQNSLSSLPSTPYRNVPNTQGPYYVSSSNAPALAAAALSPQLYRSHETSRRRVSRDSTISASDEDANIARVTDSAEEDDASDDEVDLTTSNASREAANMLRKSASFGQSRIQSNRKGQVRMGKPPTVSGLGLKGVDTQLSTSPTTAPAKQKAKDLLQSKMYGYQITKPGVPGQAESIKRRFYDDEVDVGKEPVRPGNGGRAKKRSKSTVDASARAEVGLGIGGWSVTR